MSPSPLPPGGRDVDEPSLLRLSLRTSTRSRRRFSGPTSTSMPTPSPRSIRSRRRLPCPTADSTTATPVDLFRFSTGGPSYASVVRVGLGTVPEPETQQESGSDSDLELDSPIHLIMLAGQEFDTTPMSPSASPPSPLGDTPPPFDIGPAGPLHLTMLEHQEFDTTPMSPSASPPSPPDGTRPPFDMRPAGLLASCSDTEDYHSPDEQQSSDDQDDPYFKSLVDNFISAAENVWNCKSVVPENTMYKEAGNQRQSDKLAVCALEHYNKDENNKVKYELISAITSCGILDRKGIYGHVNFIAKGNQKNSKEELFFAELRYSNNTRVPTCVLSLDGVKTIGGLCGSKYDNWKGGFFVDAKHCYACGRGLKHPKNGALYEIGHVADSQYYHLEEG